MNFFQNYIHFLLGGLLSLVTMTNPLSKVPLFISISQDLDDASKKLLAKKACIYAFFVMLGALLIGTLVLQLFGISYAALRIAGGFTISLMGYRMLFQNSDANFSPAASATDYAFFPLALPAISGPGTIAVVIGISTEIAEHHDWSLRVGAYLGTVSSMLLVCLLMFFTMRAAKWMSGILGRDGTEVTTRLMGFLLVCVGVQFIVSGVRTFWVGA